MARSFNGTTDKIALNPGACTNLNGAISLVAIVNAAALPSAGNRNAVWTADLASSSDAGYLLRVNSEGYPTLDTNSATVAPGGATNIATGAWYLIAVTKAAGTEVVKAYTYNFATKVWKEATSASTLANPTGTAAQLGVGCKVATSVSFWNGALAVIGAWDIVLAKSNLESLVNAADNKSYLSFWEALGPKGLWALNQAEVSIEIKDRTAGKADQKSLTGTTVSSGEPVEYSTVAPEITKPADQVSTEGAPTSLSITSAHATSFSAAGLPAGLTINSATGTISGTPTGVETTEVTVTAKGVGGEVSTKFNWQIVAGGVTTTLIDDFTRSDESPLAKGWAYFREKTNGVVVSNAYQALFTGYWYWTRKRFTNSAEAAMEAAALPPAQPFSYFFVAAMIQGDLASYYSFGWENGKARISKTIAGVSSTIAGDVAMTLEAGDFLAITVSGGVVHGWRFRKGAWTEILSVADSTFTKGYIGFGSYAEGSGNFWRLDNFEGGGTPIAPSGYEMIV